MRKWAQSKIFFCNTRGEGGGGGGHLLKPSAGGGGGGGGGGGEPSPQTFCEWGGVI